jgi:PH (Pleckstrin Homology) domain-containing protein
MDYKTSLDAPAKVLTWGGCALFGMLSLYQLYTYSRSPRETVDAAAAVVQIAIFAGIMLIAWLYSTQGYSVRDGVLVIHRPWKPVMIPLSEIRSVQLLSPEDVSGGTLRVFGVGGLFGYYGLFFRPNLGGYVRFYLRNKENPILLDTTGGRLLLSPDSSGLVGEIQGGGWER